MSTSRLKTGLWRTGVLWHHFALRASYVGLSQVGIPRTTTGETFLFPSNKEFESDLSPADSAQSCRKRKFKHSTVICEVKKNFSGSPVLPDLLIYYKRNTRNYCVYSFLVTFLSLFLLGIFQGLCRCQEVKEVAAA